MSRAKSAARSRRVDPLPGLTLNLEILGIGVLCVALLCALALWLPRGHSGTIGPIANATMHAWFGGGAWILVVALATIAVIIFLELHVLRMMAMFAGCAIAEFLVLDALLGMGGRGGIVGNALAHGLVWLGGSAGATIILFFALVAFFVAPTGISLKRVFGATAIGAARAGANAGRLIGAGARALQRPIDRVDAVEHAAIAPAAIGPTLVVEPEIETDDDIEPAAADPTLVVGQDHIEPLTRVKPAQSPAPLDVIRPAAPEPKPQKQVRQPVSAGGYRLPDLSLFNPPEKRVHDETSAAKTLEETLASFGVEATVTHIERGPSVTRYEMTPGRGVKVSAIKSLSDNIQLALAAQSVRIEAPIPGKGAVGIEVPNSAVSIVSMREILDYLPKVEGKLSIGLGKDITGRAVIADLARMPHLLVAGATGAGKSVCLNVILASLLSTCTPEQVQLLLVDPKRVELTEYNGIPHLIKECITDPKLAAGALYELTREMDARYERFARAGVRKIEEYNAENPDDKLPYIVVIIDELADLMLVAPTRVETSICRIAQLARATGIHLVVATQRPSVDVITGLIKANIPSRIAFAASSQVDSRTILDMAGAERLLGRGDMLYLPIDAPKPIRVQGAMVASDEIERLCEFWRGQDDPENRLDFELTEVEEDGSGPSDELALDATKIIIERQMASVALLQAELKVGHPRAVRLMKILEEYRVVGPAEGTKPRKILVGEADMPQLESLLAPRRSEQTLL
ncbi:MAG TPA: DNA translocase FtsK [Candidatus Eremiobacteraceae bacterium]|nr:DNA translocase FtsK [Candidatus Eremiobacteraceae bacterium]